MLKYVWLALVPMVAVGQSGGFQSALDFRVSLLAQLAVTNAGHRCDAIANLRAIPDQSNGPRTIADCDDGDSHILQLVPDEKSKIRSFKYRFEYVGKLIS